MSKKISELTAASSLDGSELIEVVQGGTNKQTTAQDIADLSGGAGYLVYTAILNQTGTDNPTATVLKNEIGNIVWTRAAQGNFRGTLAGAFDENKTLVLPFNNNNGYQFLGYGVNNIDRVYFQQYDSGGLPVDELNLQGIEIRIYP